MYKYIKHIKIKSNLESIKYLFPSFKEYIVVVGAVHNLGLGVNCPENISDMPYLVCA